MATTEERLAALEAKMAQLTDTTPTTYYTHQYSGEEIDNAVGRALTGGALDTSVNNVSNQLGTFVRPNLLDNWYFGRPVNQRGQMSYTGSGYGIDRWITDIDAGVGITITDNGIVIASAGTYWGTRLDNIARLSGKTVTGSILMSNGTLYSGTIESVKWQMNVAQIIFSNTDITLYINKVEDDKAQLEIGAVRAGVEILAAKLELGSTQTLAHQEGDKWVLNEVPDYGEQLRRCQRYFQTFATESLRPTNALDFRPVMRTTPALSTITVGGKTLYTASADL